jgi:hypothetical protein
MALNFPNSPTNGQVVTLGGNTYVYNTAKAAWLGQTYGTSGVTSGTYGSVDTIPIITVNSNGVITSATTAPAVSQAQVIALTIALGG